MDPVFYRTTAQTSSRTRRLHFGRPIEYRTFDVDLSAAGDDPKRGKIVGYAARFDTPGQDLGPFVEVIRPGAFKKTIRESNVRALWNRNGDYVLGRSKSGTLRLQEDEIGLAITVVPPDKWWAHDLAVSIDRGDISEMRVAFEAVKQRWTRREGEEPELMRELVEIRLRYFSLVTRSDDEETAISIRDLVVGHRLTEAEQRVLSDVLGAEARDGDPPLRGSSIDVLRRRLARAEAA